MTRTDESGRYTLLCLAIRALARRGVPLVIISRTEGYDFEMAGKLVDEYAVLVRASMLDLTLFAALRSGQRGRIRLAA